MYFFIAPEQQTPGGLNYLEKKYTPKIVHFNKKRRTLKMCCYRIKKLSIRGQISFIWSSTAAINTTAFIQWLSKNFPMCPLQCRCQPTNQRHSETRQRGFDANLGATGNHYWHQAHCLLFLPHSAGTWQTKWRFL